MIINPMHMAIDRPQKPMIDKCHIQPGASVFGSRERRRRGRRKRQINHDYAITSYIELIKYQPLN
jgi:hypothetical protein